MKRYYKRLVYECGEGRYMKVYVVMYGTKSDRVVHHYSIVDSGVEIQKVGNFWTAIDYALARVAEQR